MANQLSTDLVARGLRAYAGSLRLIDPIRLQVWDERGLTMGQLRALYVLLGEGPLPASALADRMQVRPATMTGLADRLVKHGLVERRGDDADGRVVLLALSDEGASLMHDIDEGVRAHMAEVLSRFEVARVHELIDLLEELTAAAAAVRLDEATAREAQAAG